MAEAFKKSPAQKAELGTAFRPSVDLKVQKNTPENTYCEKIVNLNKELTQKERQEQIEELKQELAKQKKRDSTNTNYLENYTAPVYEKSPEEQEFENFYFKTLGFTKQEYMQFSKNENLRRLLNNSKVLQTYTYDNDSEYDLYFYGEPFKKNSVQINIRPTRFEDSTNEYEKGGVENIPLELLKIQPYEPDLLQVLQKNKDTSQDIFDEELTTFFEGLKKIKILENYQKEETQFFQKTTSYIHQEFVEKVEKSHARFHTFLWEFLDTNKNLSTEDFQKKLEKNIHIKVFKYNKNTFKFLQAVIKKYPKDIEPAKRKNFVRLHNGKVEVSRTGDFRNDRVFFTVPIAFMEGNTYKFTYRERYEIENIKKGTPPAITVWIEETLGTARNKK